MDFDSLARRVLLALAIPAVTLGGAGCADPPPTPSLQGQVHLTFIHTSDLHSRLYPYNLQLGQVDAGLGLGAANAVVNVGGAARVSHIVGRERARADRVLHLSGGDCFQGAPVFNFFSGEAEIRTESAIGTDAMLVANHEFDRGAVNLANQLMHWADFPVLAANYQFEDPSIPGNSPLGAIVQPFTVFDVKGLKVAVIGMGNLSSLTSIFDRPNRLGITPLNTTEVAQFYVDMLRPSVDVVVLLTHLGLNVDERMIATTTGIDVVLGGHNHIVLQPPKRVQDCSAYPPDDKGNFIVLDGPDAGEGSVDCKTDADCGGGGAVCFDRKDGGPKLCKIKRYCTPRDVILAHSGAFAKYVGRLDLVVSNDKADFDPEVAKSYEAVNGFEVISHEYQLFPVTEQTPEDPVVSSLLEPYQQSLDAMANLDLLVGYALDGSKRNSTSGGDSALGNLIATAMWLRLGIQTDFALTNSTGIRTDLVPGPVTVEQMFNIFPFDNSITKMQLSGTEVQDLFDFVARRSSGRGCVSQVQIAGARIVLDCTVTDPGMTPGKATKIYIGTYQPPIKCQSDMQCPGAGPNQCDQSAHVCWQPIGPIDSYELATSNYLAAGGSGFRVLQRNTTQNDTKVQQRDALVDYIRAGLACGTDENVLKIACTTDGECGKQHVCDATTGYCDPHFTCAKDADCGVAGDGYVCACPETVVEGDFCTTDIAKSCTKGACVLSQCRDDVAAFQRQTCLAAPNDAVKQSCEKALTPCASGGEQCKFLACVDRRLGSISDGRVRMVGH